MGVRATEHNRQGRSPFVNQQAPFAAFSPRSVTLPTDSSAIGALGAAVGSDWAAYQKAGEGHQPRGLGAMPRIYRLQQWPGLSGPSVEGVLYDSEAMKQFVGLELGEGAIPDEATILNFRRLLGRHNLANAVFEAGKAKRNRKLSASQRNKEHALVRACLPHRQAPVRLPQDPSRGAGQECHASVSLMTLANPCQARGTLLAAAGQLRPQ